MANIKVTFPALVVLKQKPGSEYAQQTMTVGEVYVARGMAGSCFEVSTDRPGDWTMLHPSHFELYS